MSDFKKSDHIILCVDDDPSLREAIGEALEDTDYQIICVESFDFAIEQLAANPRKIITIVCDYDLNDPNHNGLDLRQQMDENGQEIPFILLTGKASKELAIKSIECHIDSFIEKPIVLDSFTSKVIGTADSRFSQLLDDQQMRNTFIEEARSQLSELEEVVEGLVVGQADTERLDHIFRLIHTIKGSSSFVRVGKLSLLVHQFEDYLTHCRKASDALNQSALDVMFGSIDMLNMIVETLEADPYFEVGAEAQTDMYALPEGDDDEVTTATTNTTAKKASDSRKAKNEHHVPTEILDEFMELGGELTIIRNRLNNIVKSIEIELGDSSVTELLRETFNGLHKISGQIQGKIIDLRKLPLREVFKTMPRAIRELSKTTDKPLLLEIEGDDLLVDKGIAHSLSKILTHMIRNSADHGIESPAHRTKVGKEKEGHIKISAYERSASVIIEISDDGAGLNRQAITAKALSNAMYDDEELASMPDERIYQLIFEPGFSTKAQVTGISGRGVGMDMVLNEIKLTSGHIDIESKLGFGTKFILNFPKPKFSQVTDSLVLRSGQFYFGVPIESVKSIGRSTINVLGRRPFIRIQDEITYVWKAENLVGNQANALTDGEETMVMQLQHGDKIIGLAVEECTGQFNIVVRPFDNFLKSYENFSGTAILDQHTMCLVVNSERLVDNFFLHDNLVAAS